jgi:hypothetical protein
MKGQEVEKKRKRLEEKKNIELFSKFLHMLSMYLDRFCCITLGLPAEPKLRTCPAKYGRSRMIYDDDDHDSIGYSTLDTQRKKTTGQQTKPLLSILVASGD